MNAINGTSLSVNTRKVRSFTVSRCDSIKERAINDFLGGLYNPYHLQKLTLEGCKLSPAFMDSLLVRAKGLKELRLDMSFVPDLKRNVEKIGSFEMLESLALEFPRNGPVCDEPIQTIAAALGPRLKSFTVRNSVTHGIIKQLCNHCPNLVTLDLSQADETMFHIPDHVVPYLVRLSKLRALKLNSSNVSDCIVNVLQNCPQLVQLDVQFCSRITNQTLLAMINRARSNPKQIYKLSAWRTSVSLSSLNSSDDESLDLPSSPYPPTRHVVSKSIPKNLLLRI